MQEHPWLAKLSCMLVYSSFEVKSSVSEEAIFNHYRVFVLRCIVEDMFFVDSVRTV